MYKKIAFKTLCAGGYKEVNTCMYVYIIMNE